MVVMVRTRWFLLIKYPLRAFLPNLPNSSRRWVLASAASCGRRTRLMGTAYPVRGHTLPKGDRAQVSGLWPDGLTVAYLARDRGCFQDLEECRALSRHGLNEWVDE